MLEGGLRIPAIVSWPARLPQGVTTNQVGISMDWLPTLLAAAGTAPDPDFPSDGTDLLPVLSGSAPVQERSLFWRYKAHAQRAARVGDYKFLKLRQNTFLFNVVADPLERANLKNRLPDLYARMKADWLRWNATMLPEIDASFTEGYTGAHPRRPSRRGCGADGGARPVMPHDQWQQAPRRTANVRSPRPTGSNRSVRSRPKAESRTRSVLVNVPVNHDRRG